MADFEAAKEKLKDLPVMQVAGDVVTSVMQDKVTILAAPTGSGKSMIVPSMLADASDDQVVVMLPGRFLATSAATNVAELSGKELGKEVGYAIGRVGGEKSRKSEHTKLLFVTYGYAISSGLINTAKTLVLDEVHEAGEDASLARAVLYRRKAIEPNLHILEMSATVNADRQAGYWKDVAGTTIKHVEGIAPTCEERVESDKGDGKGRTVEQAALDLITQEKRNGIAIFRPGIKEIEKTVEELERLIADKRIKQVEVASIYRGTPADERKKATAPPRPGWRKILVGTNVIESSVNLRWLDSGISDGSGKIPYQREDTGADVLKHEHLPQWRIIQQKGRINRDPKATGFDKGIFILHSREEWRNRQQQATPEIERISLARLAFRAAALKLNPEELHFDAKVDAHRLSEAKQDLIRLQLIHDDWSLTDDGKYAATLPLGPQAGAMLCEARRLDLPLLRSSRPPNFLSDAIIMAALVENDGMRADYRRSHGKDATSDVLDGLKTFQELSETLAAKTVMAIEAKGEDASEIQLMQLEQQREKLAQECAARNVSFNSFQDVSRLVTEIRNRHNPKDLAVDIWADPDASHYNALKQIILNGKVNGLFVRNDDKFRDLMRDYGGRRNNAGGFFSDYTLSDFSTVKPVSESATPLVVGTLREIPSKLDSDGQREPETMLTQVTSIPTEVFLKWAMGRNDVVLSEVTHDLGRHQNTKASKRAAGDTAELSARYFDKASFTLPLPKITPEVEQLANELADRAVNGVDMSAAVYGGFKPRKAGQADRSKPSDRPGR